MASTSLPQIKVKALPVGSDEYERKRAEIVDALNALFPAELHLDRSLVENPPLDVTGIPRTCGILSPEEIDITDKYDATGLLEAIAARKYTAVAVAMAFCKRAAIAHQLTCCLTDFFMEDAIKQAKMLDEYLETNGTTIGPLHGLPISVKEHMPIAGRTASWGLLMSVTKTETDCLMVETLRNAGAVMYCKTHQPQAIMHLESTSFYGRTLNPHNINLSAGGSSGGEGALSAMKGSVLGLGSDIGGSIRGPSGFCNVSTY